MLFYLLFSLIFIRTGKALIRILVSFFPFNPLILAVGLVDFSYKNMNPLQSMDELHFTRFD